MSEMAQSGGAADRHTRLVEMWRQAVSASSEAMGLIELSTTRLLGLSRRAAELLGTTPEEGSGLEYLSVTDHPREVADAVRLARDGVVDGIRARRVFRPRGGATVAVETCGWAIRSETGDDLGLWVDRESHSRTYDSVVTDEVIDWYSIPAGLGREGPRVTLDDRWRITSSSAGSLLGRSPAELRGMSIIELTHPNDLTALFFTFARATNERKVGVRIRLRHQDGGWRTSHVSPTALEGERKSAFSLVVAIDEAPGGPESSGEVNDLAGHLRRIAAQIEAAGVQVETADYFRVPAMSGLSARQREIVSRLVRGQRVPSIAAEMYLSKSTVRNHLSAIFRKFGVHSQQEFLALWRDQSGF